MNCLTANSFRIEFPQKASTHPKQDHTQCYTTDMLHVTLYYKAITIFCQAFIVQEKCSQNYLVQPVEI